MPKKEKKGIHISVRITFKTFEKLEKKKKEFDSRSEAVREALQSFLTYSREKRGND